MLDRPGLIGTMSFRLAIPGGLPSGSARFRFTNHAQNALQWSCRSRIFQRTANSVLFDCLSVGVHPSLHQTCGAAIASEGGVMQTLIERGCGLDVHQATVVAWLVDRRQGR